MFHFVLTAITAISLGITAPDGTEWQNPENLSLGKEAAHAWFFSFKDLESARKVLPENSSYWKSLDGDWKFKWSPSPAKRPVGFQAVEYDVTSWDTIQVPGSWNIQGLQKDGTQKYGTPIYVNVNVPFWHEKKVDDWKGGVMRTPPTNWTMFEARNEIGSYKRSFTIPQEWKGREIYIDFNGVDSFFYLWINGKYVGFSKNSRNLAQFDITPYVQDGENTVAVEVYRNSDGSNLEAQDMWRLPGIFRTVAIESRPKIHISELKVTPCGNTLRVETSLNEPKKQKGYSLTYKLYECELYSDANSPVATFARQEFDDVIGLPNARKWSAEEPYRYVLIGELTDWKGKVTDVVSSYVGFRDVEIKDVSAEDDEYGLAGKYFHINGKCVKLRGVNRHETEPERGHAIRRESMVRDVMLMKRANINHVRNSHYPDDPYWYYLCDKYGIYLMDEANTESHHYGYEEASLSHPMEWRKAHIDRMMAMMKANYNHPSIVIWSMGNEAGPGENFLATYNAAKEYDPMRPVQYERNNDYSDIGCRQYPPVDWVRNVATGKADEKYPYHINEFAHSMGNALGNFADYWASMDSNNYFIGGCIWDWVDQSMYNYTSDGTRYLAYGGDYGDYPNDAEFLMNGVLFGDRSPKPQYYEVKKVYQPVYTSLKNGKVEIFNRQYFCRTNLDCRWELVLDGDVIDKGTYDINSLKPREKRLVEIPPYSENHHGALYLNVYFTQKEKTPWADKGYEVAKDQILLNASVRKGTAMSVKAGALRAKAENGRYSVCGDDFHATFNTRTATLDSYSVKGRKIVSGGAFEPARAAINNDAWMMESWEKNEIYNLKHSATLTKVVKEQDGSIELQFTTFVHGQTDSTLNFRQHQTWRIDPDGTLTLSTKSEVSNPQFTLGRFGFAFTLPKEFDTAEYCGRGPEENYCDRKTSAFVGKYTLTIDTQKTLQYTKPQECGNHEEVSTLTLRDKDGYGITIVPVTNTWDRSGMPEARMTFSIQCWDLRDMKAAGHIYQLPEAGETRLLVNA
ncbi:MAG: DUF4981 domain-containing protein, partial [Bacteroidales bacterium]|nr:DUF4981 domain-containing protein [Bacteroidales bacterium]